MASAFASRSAAVEGLAGILLGWPSSGAAGGSLLSTRFYPKLVVLRTCLADLERTSPGAFFATTLPAILRAACDEHTPTEAIPLAAGGAVRLERLAAFGILCNAFLLNVPHSSPLDFLGGGVRSSSFGLARTVMPTRPYASTHPRAL